MTAVPVQGNAASGGARSVESEGQSVEADQGVMPIDDTTQPQAISPC